MPRVCTTPVPHTSAGEMTITTRYPDGTTESLRGKGTINGKLRLADLHSDIHELVMVVVRQDGNEYKIRIPGWQDRINPFDTDWWVVAEYSFSESSEWLRIMAQGHGQVFMYYTGRAVADKTADPVLGCRLHNRLFTTSDHEPMSCSIVLDHYSVTCEKDGSSWQLAPGTSMPIGQDGKTMAANTRILHLVDAFKVKKGCQSMIGSRMTYYWFKLPYKAANSGVVNKNDE